LLLLGKAKEECREFMKLKLTAVVASIVTLILPIITAGVSAQSTSGQSTQVTNNSNSMRISPVRTDVIMDPGSTKQLTVYAQNLGTLPVQARAIISDFAASTDETGKPSVILEEEQYAPSHSLKRLALTEPSVVTLPPNTRVPVKVTITVPKNAMAGGYYGAVRFIPVSTLTTGNDTGVAISTNVGSLILLKVNGALVEKVSLVSFDVRQDDKASTFFKKPDGLKAVVRFKNDGNVQTQPFGKVRLLDRSGKVIEEHEINNTDPRGNVLPTSIRRFDPTLEKVGSFGKYTLEGNFGYGSNGELLTSKLSFWVVPTTYMIAGGVALIILILMAIFIPRMIRSYNRRIVRRAGRRY
jgi:hypothetical protein